MRLAIKDETGLRKRKLVRLREACLYAIDHYGLRNDRSDVVVRIVKSGESGLRGFVKHDWSRTTVTIVRDWTPRMIETIFHEFCHVRQYLRGELKNVRDGVLWQGVPHSYHDHKSYLKYFRQPWEVDARSAGRHHNRNFLLQSSGWDFIRDMLS